MRVLTPVRSGSLSRRRAGKKHPFSAPLRRCIRLRKGVLNIPQRQASFPPLRLVLAPPSASFFSSFHFDCRKNCFSPNPINFVLHVRMRWGGGRKNVKGSIHLGSPPPRLPLFSLCSFFLKEVYSRFSGIDKHVRARGLIEKGIFVQKNPIKVKNNRATFDTFAPHFFSRWRAQRT